MNNKYLLTVVWKGGVGSGKVGQIRKSIALTMSVASQLIIIITLIM